MKTLKLGVQTRTLPIEREGVDEEGMRVRISMSSEVPVPRWFGTEVLGHKDGEIRTARLDALFPVRAVGHDGEIRGVLENWRVKGKRLEGTVRFSPNQPEARTIFNDVRDGILGNASIAYYVHAMDLTKKKDDGPSEYRATDWEPVHIAIVGEAADITVGAGRSAAIRGLEGYGEREIPVRVAGEDAEEEEVAAPAASEPEAARGTEVHMEPKDEGTVRSEAAQAALSEERKRMAEIRSLRDRFRGKVKDIDGIADDALSRGTSAVDFKDAVLERMAEQKPVAPQAVDPAKIGMSEKDLRNYSLFRAIRAFVDKSSDAGLEFEASRAMAEQIGRDPRGFFVPQDVLADPRYGRAFAQRAGSPLNVTTAAEGGDLVATNLLAGSFIEMLYNATVVSAAGATILDGLVGNVDIPRQTAGADFAWVAENIAPAEDASTAFDQVALTPKTVGGWVAMTRRLLKQSTPAVEGLVRRDLVRGAGVAIDKGALIESGAANNPKGVINQTGVASVVMGNPDGALPTWAKMVEFETGPAAANAEGSAMAYIVNAKTRGVLKVTKKDDGSGMFVWDTGNAAATPINGYRAFVTNILRSNLSKGGSSGILSEAVFGNWSDLLIGMWGGLDIFPDPYTQADKGNLILRVFQDCDVAVRHGVSFAASSDIKTS